jgi:hypothetical protein
MPLGSLTLNRGRFVLGVLSRMKWTEGFSRGILSLARSLWFAFAVRSDTLARRFALLIGSWCFLECHDCFLSMGE